MRPRPEKRRVLSRRFRRVTFPVSEVRKHVEFCPILLKSQSFASHEAGNFLDDPQKWLLFDEKRVLTVGDKTPESYHES